MRKNISKEALNFQFMGFLNTPSLWKNQGPVGVLPYEFKPLTSRPGDIGINVPSNLVLGKRIEYFFSHYIEAFTSEEVLTSNSQIVTEKTTVGELDFILRDPRSNEVFHVELVYKFYLYDPTFSTEEERWIGPNRRDSLLKKLQRLQTHQFPLLYRPETRPLLDLLGLNPRGIKQRLCFKANLFVPFALLGNNFSMVNNECITGFWIRAKDFTEAAFDTYCFFTPQKADWPRDPGSNKEWFTFSEINPVLKSFIAEERSPLIWMKIGKARYIRFFLVWW